MKRPAPTARMTHEVMKPQKKKVVAHGQSGGKIIWPRQMLVPGVDPSLRAIVRCFVPLEFVGLPERAAGASPNQRAICAKIAPR